MSGYLYKELYSRNVLYSYYRILVIVISYHHQVGFPLLNSFAQFIVAIKRDNAVYALQRFQKINPVIETVVRSRFSLSLFDSLVSVYSYSDFSKSLCEL
jgi:hypothetical protein